MNLPLVVNVNILGSSQWQLVSQSALHCAKIEGRRVVQREDWECMGVLSNQGRQLCWLSRTLQRQQHGFLEADPNSSSLQRVWAE